MTLRIAFAQHNFLVGDIVKNTAKVRHLAQQAQAQDCDVLVFPELCLTGYPPEDLLLRASLALRIERCFAKSNRHSRYCFSARLSQTYKWSII
jgi:NAD+ synthase (glutamine-hydrolysing)